MTRPRVRPQAEGIMRRIVDSLRGGQNMVSTPHQAIQGLAGALGQSTITSSEGTSLTVENLERMMAQVSTSQVQSQSNQTATEMQLRREATRQINEVEGIEAPVPVPREEAKRLFPKDKDWEKLYQSHKPIEEKVSHLLVHSQNKVLEIKKILEDTENRHRDIRKAVREATKQTKDLTRDIRELKKRKKELELETEEKKKLRATRVVQDVLALPKVRKIEVDEKKRIFITTDDMEVMKDYWDKPRTAGQYQILVDFYEMDIRGGVRVLNITKRLKDQYDHPCINNTRPCWGNIQNEIRESFKDRDLLEIVITMFLYISSPNDDTGYISYRKKSVEERHKQGWEEFLEFATPCPKNFSFLKYEKQQSRRPTTGLTVDGEPTPDLRAYATTLGSLASTSRPIPQQISRLPHFLLDEQHFGERLIRHINTIVEFMDLDRLRELAVRIQHMLRRSNMIFIKEIEFMYNLEIRGFCPGGYIQEAISFMGESVRQREQRILRFDPPPWFRDVGRPSEYYSQEYPNTVTMNTSTGVVDYGNVIPIDNI